MTGQLIAARRQRGGRGRARGGQVLQPNRDLQQRGVRGRGRGGRGRGTNQYGEAVNHQVNK